MQIGRVLPETKSPNPRGEARRWSWGYWILLIVMNCLKVGLGAVVWLWQVLMHWIVTAVGDTDLFLTCQGHHLLHALCDLELRNSRCGYMSMRARSLQIAICAAPVNTAIPEIKQNTQL